MKEEFRNLIKEIEGKEKQSLIRVMTFWISPITQKLEYRVAYFIDYAEAIIWRDEIMKIEKTYDSGCSSYIDFIGGIKE